MLSLVPFRVKIAGRNIANHPAVTNGETTIMTNNMTIRSSTTLPHTNSHALEREGFLFSVTTVEVTLFVDQMRGHSQNFCSKFLFLDGENPLLLCHQNVCRVEILAVALCEPGFSL